MKLPVRYLGQSGWRLQFPEVIIYIDPYLSNSVQELDAPDLTRLRPIPFSPESIHDADYVLITHEHMDHCDPFTIPKIAEVSPQSIFIAPMPVLSILKGWGISENRLILASEKWEILAETGVEIHAIPAAHLDIQRDANGHLSYVGYMLQYAGRRIYFAGDTCVHPEVVDAVTMHSPIHTVVLPVNEHNYYRAQRGIVGNMSIREAFQFASELGVENVIPVHWDMFQINSASPEEMRAVYNHMGCDFRLHIEPDYINIGGFDVSVVIRTLNEEEYLEALLEKISSQDLKGLKAEVVIVDSGSKDKTLSIANRYGCHIVHIEKKDFSFGRSLNLGCRSAVGDVLVIASGHCVPVGNDWLMKMCKPIFEKKAEYVYGRQLGGVKNYFSEHRIFEKYYPKVSQIPQDGFFCNNANSAIRREICLNYLFDEELTGLEDMELAKRLVQSGGAVAYISDAPVYHNHAETWSQIRRRFEREAIALQKIMPQLQINFFDMLRYVVTSCIKDLSAVAKGVSGNIKVKDIILYRCNQYLGSWVGNRQHRKLSYKEKEKYFFPE
jgi:L-ascorbate metabolism protein UlaG (beta-lactamase superfamily)/GT2 family glycosyltransferase